ncbi:MAG: glutaredoxin family protein [Candidatus Saccharibacteria bacterium]|nr:glutaredoxin family protein [Candidatus Saccharibacteria bacterium]
MIKVYSAEWCPYCHAEMEWLDEMGVEYEEVDIDKEGIKMSSIPVTEIGDERIEGFNRAKIKRVLKKNGLI